MATVSNVDALASASRKPVGTAYRGNILVRALHAVMEGRQRKADRALAEILARRGGIVTDELEPSSGEMAAALPVPRAPDPLRRINHNLIR